MTLGILGHQLEGSGRGASGSGLVGWMVSSRGISVCGKPLPNVLEQEWPPRIDLHPAVLTLTYSLLYLILYTSYSFFISFREGPLNYINFRFPKPGPA